MLGRLARGAVVPEVTVGEAGQQVRLNDRDETDDRRCAVENTLGLGEGPGRSAVGQVNRRAGVTDFA